jgi:beta-RFAP synthase
VAEHDGWEARSAVDLARLVGRGQRSALGIYGFDQGGFLVEGGKQGPAKIAPLLTRLAFPEPWRVVLVLPPWKQGLHGQEERTAFGRLDHGACGQTDVLCRLVLLGLLPTILEEDFQGFSESLYEFNHLAGGAFAPVQGGPYATPQVADLVHSLRQLGIKGVGQSSWGPTVFAVAADEEQATWLVRQIQTRWGFGPQEVLSTAANNTGCTVVKGTADEHR